MLRNNKNIRVFLTSMLSLFIILLTIFSSTIPAKATSISGQAVIAEAMTHLGKPYSWGSNGPNTFDCSGFTQFVYKNESGIEIGRATNNQINSGREISQNELKPGDLIFTNPGHVGIFIGNGQMIHAPGKGDVVKISSVYNFWRARRIIESSSNIEDLLFNSSFYSNKYSDLRNIFGNDSSKLHSHFYTSGIKEGRSASEVFDVSYYLSHNPDLIKIFGSTNYASAYNHFITIGYKESRDLSPVFNMDYYLKNNPDIANAYTNNFYGVLNHFLTSGMKEGRNASENFNLNNYKKNYEDLRNAFGNNNEAYYNHYLTIGINEGRVAK